MNRSLNSLIKQNVCLIAKHFRLVYLVNEAVTHIEPVLLVLVVIASVSYIVATTHAA